ncbi:MAG: hypothetical protein H0W73_12145 [Bacteroidetes bacterium]|nr:hypothetical protein [Bacteroidota bacterium]
MKTEKELNSDILKMTMKIREVYPELLKYMSEMPFKISYAVSNTLNLIALNDYYDSLHMIYKKYATNHQNKF